MVDNQASDGVDGGYGVRMLIFFELKVGAKLHKILMHSKFYYSENYWQNRNASVSCQKWEQSDTTH
jgi:hypothetical protein